MARRKTPETLDDLLAGPLAAGTITAWCRSHGLQPFTVYRLRRGQHRANSGTVALLAAALGVTIQRTRAAIDASRAAAGK